MKTRTVVAVVIAVVAAGALFAAFWIGGYSATVTPPTPTVQTQPANPVPILTSMHVPLSSGESIGQVDLYGDRYASGTFADGEQVTVYTYADDQTLAAGVQRFGSPSDVDKYLLGPMFIVEVTGVDTGNGISFPVSVASLAKLSGTVLD
jgi:hypothetical protein